MNTLCRRQTTRQRSSAGGSLSIAAPLAIVLVIGLVTLVTEIPAQEKAGGAEARAGTGAARTRLPELQFRRAIQLAGTQAESLRLVAIDLDSHVYRSTNRDQPDLRVVNRREQMTGTLRQAAAELQTRTVRKSWRVQPTAVQIEGESRLTFELVLGDSDHLPSGLKLISPLKDFEHQVLVESTADGVTWVPVAEPSMIFDYSRFVAARNDTLAWTAVGHRRYRVTISDVTSEQRGQLTELLRNLQGTQETSRVERETITRRPFRVDGVELIGDETVANGRTVKLRTESPESWQTEDDNTKLSTVISLHTSRQPVTMIRLLTDDLNFSRAVTVRGGSSENTSDKSWRHVTSGTISRLAVGSIQKEQLTIEIPESTDEWFTIEVHNRESPPLAVAGVELRGPQYQIVFVSEPGETYELRYGNPRVSPADLDLAALRAAIDQNLSPVLATLSKPEQNTIQPIADPWQPWNDRRLLLTGIVLGAVVVGLALFRAAQKLKSTDV